jgi:putative inorganic carbon (hco3(-)) transporter
MGLRDIALFLIVFGGIPFILRSPAVGIMYWTWVSMMNPHLMAFGAASEFPFAALIAASTFVGLVVSRKHIRFKPRPEVLLLLVFAVHMTISTTTALNPDGAWPAWDRAMKVLLLTFVAIAVLHTKRDVQLLVGILALSVGFFGVKGGLYTLREGGEGRVFGPGGFLSENNSTGLAILMTIPLIWYFFLQVRKPWMKWALLLACGLSAVAVLGTQSRGAFLAIVAIGLFLLVKSPRRLPVAIGLFLVAPALILFMPQKWDDRMRTIETYEEDGSAMGRINAWEMSFNLANDRPLIGGGFDCYTPETYAKYRPGTALGQGAHSIYFQVLGEHGWVGLLLYLAIWFFTWRDASEIIRISKKNPDLMWARQLAAMLQVSLVGFFVGGAFLNLANWDMPYYMLVAIVVTFDLIKRSADVKASTAPLRADTLPELRTKSPTPPARPIS